MQVRIWIIKVSDKQDSDNRGSTVIISFEIGDKSLLFQLIESNTARIHAVSAVNKWYMNLEYSTIGLQELTYLWNVLATILTMKRHCI